MTEDEKRAWVAAENRADHLEVCRDEEERKNLDLDKQLGSWEERALAAEAERDALKKVLEWYANPENYGDEGDAGAWESYDADLEHAEGWSEWEADNGDRARAALTASVSTEGPRDGD